MSSSTIKDTRSLKVVCGDQPNFDFAFSGFPINKSTSAGRERERHQDGECHLGPEPREEEKQRRGTELRSDVKNLEATRVGASSFLSGLDF